MFTHQLTRFFDYIDTTSIRVRTYLKNNLYLVSILIVAALAAYGFELFNFNITPDEEIHATYLGHIRTWILQGRWGMYLLNKFVIPYTVVPFVPLFIGLLFYIMAVLLFLKSWKIVSGLEQIVFGTISITFPVVTFMYTFSTINYGVGIGLFLIALSTWIYSTSSGWHRLLALFPAALAIAIYQGFTLVSIAAFLIYIILDVIRSNKVVVNNILVIALVNMAALMVYFLMQKIFMLSMGSNLMGSYVGNFFSWEVFLNLSELYQTVRKVIFELVLPVYLGDKSIYALSAGAFGGLLFISMLNLFFNFRRHRLSIINRLFVVFLSFSLLIVPFAGAFFVRVTLMRFLIAAPLAASGFIMISMLGSHRGYKVLVALLASYCVLQFSLVSNHLFAASHLALQADRILAANLMDRINDAQIQAGAKKVRFIEIVGYYDAQETQLIPKRETFGVSFFELGQGNNERIAAFLQTLRMDGLSPLPDNQRDDKFFDFVNAMPEWPLEGSVKIFRGNIVVIKFSPYSHFQRAVLCQQANIQTLLHYAELCK